MTGGENMAVHHNDFKTAIERSFDESDIKFDKVSDLSKEEFERLLASAIKACVETHDFAQHVRNLK
jgi:hypothetical protein